MGLRTPFQGDSLTWLLAAASVYHVALSMALPERPHNVAPDVPQNLVQPISEATRHHFWHVLLITGVSLSPGPTQ